MQTVLGQLCMRAQIRLSEPLQWLLNLRKCEDLTSRNYCFRAGPIIEEVSDEEADRLISGQKSRSLEATSDPVEYEQSGMKNIEASTTRSQSVPVLPNTAAFGDTLNALKQNPEMLR